MKTLYLNYFICGRTDGSMGLSEQVESESDQLRACWSLLWKLKEVWGDLQEIWNAGQTRQHTHFPLSKLDTQQSEEKNESGEMDTARNYITQSLVSGSAHPSDDAKPWTKALSSMCKFRVLGTFVPGVLRVVFFFFFLIEVKIPQKYNSQAIWKVHRSEPESGSTQRHQEQNREARSVMLPHPKKPQPQQQTTKQRKKTKPKQNKKHHYCHKWDLILPAPGKSRQAGLHPRWEEVPILLGPCVLAPFMGQWTGTCAGIHCWNPLLSANCTRGPGVFL